MNSSKIIIMITVTALIMLLIIPVQSKPTRHKRWTFNSWRLHGRRLPTHPPTHSTTESYSPIISTDVNHQNQPINIDNDDDDDDNDSYKTLLRLLHFFQMLDHEQKTRENGYK